MSDETPSQNKNITLSNKEKVAGGVLGLGLAGLLVYGLYLAMPILLAVTWGLLQISVAVTAIGALLYVVTDKGTRAVLARAYRLLVRKMWYAVMTYDPIGNLKEHILQMEKKFQQMGQQRQVLHGQVVGLQREIKKNDEERTEALKLAQAARGTPGGDEVFTFQGAKAGRRERTNQKLNGLLTTLTTCDRVLAKMHKNLGFLIEDTKDEVDQVTREFVATKAAGAAAESAMDIINGDPETKQMYEDTMSHIEQQVADRLGKFEMLMSDSEGFLKSIDIRNAMYKQSALDALQAWEKKSDQLLLNPGKQRVDTAGVTLDAEFVPASTEQDEVSDLFQKR